MVHTVCMASLDIMLKMYILASVFFEKDDKYIFKAFKYVFIVFFETKQMIIYICTSEI